MTTSVLDHRFGRSAIADRVADSVAALPVEWATDNRRPAMAYTWDGEARRRRGGDVEWRVIVSPGSVQLATARATGWERDRLEAAERERLQRGVARTLKLLDNLDMRLADEAGDWFGQWDYYDERDRLLGTLENLRMALGLSSAKRGRSRCGEWSRRSRSRMVRRGSTLDWSRMVAREISTPAYGRVWAAPAMVTLTYPADYLAVAPTGERSKEQVATFRKAWERHMGPSECFWKLERQRRGAPHYHLLLMVPMANERALHLLRAWARLTWARIVGAKGDDRAKHERAGVSIDLSATVSYTDPKRIMTYFAKHNSAAVDSPKSYQNLPPDGWLDPDDGGGVGRWWGYWRMRPVEVSAVVDELAAVAMQRTLRAWVRSQKRTRVTKRKRINRRSGVVRLRKQTERYTVRALAGCRPAGFVLANDAPALVRAIARSLEEPGDWLRGERRSLP